MAGRAGGAPHKFWWRCFLVKRGSLLRASAIHFVETYNLTRVLMSVANKYRNDRRRVRRSFSGAGAGGQGERDGESLLAKYLGGQQAR